MLIANGLELIIFKNLHMAGRERQPDKYAVKGFLIYEYKNILNLDGKSSLRRTYYMKSRYNTDINK